MDKSTYKTLSTMTADLQKRFDFVFKAIKTEPVPPVAEDSGKQEQEQEDWGVQNPLAPIPAEVPQGLDSTSHQEESKTALEDNSSLAYTDLPEAQSSSGSGLQEMLDYIMKVTSSTKP